MSGLASYLVTGFQINGQERNKHIFCDISWICLCSVIESGLYKFQVCWNITCNFICLMQNP